MTGKKWEHFFSPYRDGAIVAKAAMPKTGPSDTTPTSPCNTTDLRYDYCFGYTTSKVVLDILINSFCPN